MSDSPSPVSRRDFVLTSTAAGMAVLAGPAARLARAEPTTRAIPAMRPPAPFELDEITIGGLQEGMRSGKYTARSIAERYLARIDEVDRNGPSVNSIIEVNPQALEIAEGLDRERREGRVRGPLHGIPVVIKDNIDTADRMHTTAGSLALAESVAPRDAYVAARLREAGAVLLAKTNLSEWANFRSTHSTSGWSGRGGQTKNPWALDRNPCGSSSGSGAAVSANLAAVAVGTETDGSIVCPSNASGIVGIKPTLGLVSRSGIVPIAHSQDTAGPMARTVTDAAILLGVLAGVDPRDAATAASRGKAQSDYTRFLDARGLQGKRIGVARNYFGFSMRVDAILEESLAALKDAGAVLVDPANMENAGKYDDSEFEVLLYEFKADLNAYLSSLAPSVRPRTLAGLIEFNEANKDREMPWFGQEIFLSAQKKGPLSEKAYREALAKNHRLSREEGIDATMKTHRLDAIVAPTGGPAWLTDLVNGDHFGGGSSTAAAVAGYPSITVPAGYVYGLPVGLSFIAGAWAEPALIAMAYAFEQTTKVRKAPGFLPSADLRA